VGGPGLAFETWVSPTMGPSPEHPGLKSETWATHSTLVRSIFIFLDGPRAHQLSGRDDSLKPIAGITEIVIPAPERSAVQGAYL